MKTLLIIVNTAIVCYAIHLIATYDPLQAAIQHAVLQVVLEG